MSLPRSRIWELTRPIVGRSNGSSKTSPSEGTAAVNCMAPGIPGAALPDIDALLTEGHKRDTAPPNMTGYRLVADEP